MNKNFFLIIAVVSYLYLIYALFAGVLHVVSGSLATGKTYTKIERKENPTGFWLVWTAFLIVCLVMTLVIFKI